MGALNNIELFDPNNRRIKSLRISITQRCNFNCFFCHQEGESKSGDELSIDEIEILVKVGAGLGIKKVKMTGGEPLWEAIGNPLGFGGIVGGGILVFLIILAVPAGRRRLFSVEPYGGRDVLEEVVKCILLGGLAGAAVWLCVGCAINIDYV